MLYFFFLVLLAHAKSVRPQNHVLKQTPYGKNIFILAGQSNMAGRGGVTTQNNTATWDGVVPMESHPNPSILRFSGDMLWVEALEPLHADIDSTKTNGVGPGLPFANAVLTKAKDFGVIGLVPCAIGGTNVSEWERGKNHYKNMMKRVKASLQEGGVIRALLWFQGESDTNYKEDAQNYKTKIEEFFRDVRTDLQSPMLPIIQVALASGEGQYVEIVREAQLGIEMVNLATVDAEGSPLNPDKLHLTTQSQVRLGFNMATAFLQFVPESITSDAPTMRIPNFGSENFLVPFLINFSAMLLRFFKDFL